jgi:AraC-like DNA-binding protein
VATIPLTKSHQFWPLTDYLQGIGVPIGTYLERARLPQKMLEAPDLFVDESRFWRFAEDLAHRQGILDWGFESGQRLDFSVLGEFGNVLMQQPTLKSALDTFTSTISAEAFHCQSELMQQGNQFWFVLGQKCPKTSEGMARGKDIIELYNLEFMLKLVRKAIGNHWLPETVHLQSHSLPAGVEKARLTRGKIRFASTVTAIAIPVDKLSAPMSGHRSCTYQSNLTHPPLSEKLDFATSLKLLLAGYVDERITIDECADLVGLSGRTLQRRLAEHETTFNELLDQTRFEVAKELLRDDSIPISDVCYEVGYADPGNFTRAFRRWTGVSPRQHRQLHLA